MLTGGDPHLGGDDWDAAIVEWIKSQLAAEVATSSRTSPTSRNSATSSKTTLDLKDPKIQANLRSLAELAKIELSVNKAVTLK
jgi:molecular chaperone DnaK (HSP70)